MSLTPAAQHVAFRDEILATPEGALVGSGGKQFLWLSHQSCSAVAFAASEPCELTGQCGAFTMRRGGLAELLSFPSHRCLPALCSPDAPEQSGKEVWNPNCM